MAIRVYSQFTSSHLVPTAWWLGWYEQGNREQMRATMDREQARRIVRSAPPGPFCLDLRWFLGHEAGTPWTPNLPDPIVVSTAGILELQCATAQANVLHDACLAEGRMPQVVYCDHEQDIPGVEINEGWRIRMLSHRRALQRFIDSGSRVCNFNSMAPRVVANSWWGRFPDVCPDGRTSCPQLYGSWRWWFGDRSTFGRYQAMRLLPAWNVFIDAVQCVRAGLQYGPCMPVICSPTTFCDGDDPHQVAALRWLFVEMCRHVALARVGGRSVDTVLSFNSSGTNPLNVNEVVDRDLHDSDDRLTLESLTVGVPRPSRLRPSTPVQLANDSEEVDSRGYVTSYAEFLMRWLGTGMPSASVALTSRGPRQEPRTAMRDRQAWLASLAGRPGLEGDLAARRRRG